MRSVMMLTPFRSREECHQLRLQVGWEAGVGMRRHIDRSQAFGRVRLDLRRSDLETGARLQQLVEKGRQVIGTQAAHRDLRIGDQPRDDERTRFDAIGNDAVTYAAEFVNAVDHETVRTDSVDPRPHRDETPREIVDFGFDRRAFDHGSTARERRGHQHVGRPCHRWAERRTQVDVRADQSTWWSFGFDVAVFHGDARTERFESLQVQVDRAHAERATARQRDARLAAAREQRPENANRTAHLPHEFIRSRVLLLVARLNAQRAVVAADFATEFLQHFRERAHVAQIGNVVENDGFARE